MTEMVERVRAVAWYLRVRTLEDELERTREALGAAENERDYLADRIQRLSETGQL